MGLTFGNLPGANTILPELQINSKFQNFQQISNNPGIPNYLLSPDQLFSNLKKSSKQLKPIEFFKDIKTNVLPPLPLLNNEQSNGKVVGVAKGTGYFPFNDKMEGGFYDKIGKKLCTLQDYLAGKVPYVSIALDKNLYKKGVIKYGDKFRIPELEQKYGRVIEFRAVDTGGAFTNRGFGRVDICTRSRKNCSDATVNGKLTLIKA